MQALSRNDRKQRFPSLHSTVPQNPLSFLSPSIRAGRIASSSMAIASKHSYGIHAIFGHQDTKYKNPHKPETFRIQCGDRGMPISLKNSSNPIRDSGLKMRALPAEDSIYVD
jgi:hypothetical protein